MPISWNEIKTRSLAFSKEWENEKSEDAEAKSFWDGFFDIFGISRRRVASFEEPVKKLGSKQGFIDLFWKGVLLVEHKSRGKSLDKAYTQALDYFQGIKERDLPKYVLVSDFERFRLYDLEASTQQEIKQVYNSENNDSPALPCNYHESCNYKEFELKDLHKYVKLFGFIAGYQTHKIQEQDPVNIQAAEQMGKLHDLMKDVGYDGHALELYLVRLLFCMFAEDTGIFERQQFQDYIEDRTNQDGSDLAYHINAIFQTLNTPEQKRFKNLDEQLAAFPYINGKLFEEMLPTASFDSAMRQSLLDSCALDWSRISPAIFGSLFQSIMDKTARRNLGAHYTSETNILKLIKPLFLDSLWEEFEKIKSNKNKLIDFHKKLRNLTFLDPACGCGNFLVITYRELRLLELEVLRALKRDDKQQTLDVHSLIQLNVDQFYGIEIEEFPSQIAQVALWLMDHQMNLIVSEEFGLYFARIPLSSSSKIICGNALQIDWNEILPAEKLSYIMGNPPFVGHQWRTAEQMADMTSIWGKDGRFGRLDYVTCWYKRTVALMKQHNKISAAFVSTNSISQGEQVGILWAELLAEGTQITFAHQTFQWNSEARGKAAVHCVIIGFTLSEVKDKIIFEYENIKHDAHAIKVNNINPYLIDAPNIILPSRTSAPAHLPKMIKGSQPTDGGYLLLNENEKEELLKQEPNADSLIRSFSMGNEFINNIPRFCLWLKDVDPKIVRGLPLVMKRVSAVAEIRRKSPTKSVQEFANNPTLFTQDRQPTTDYLAIPRVSSERRIYIPIGFMAPKHIAGDKLQLIVNAKLFHFGVVTSIMHMAWMRIVAGRLKNDYSYSPSVYNNFPWPENPTDKQKKTIEDAAQAVLDARSQFPESSLADLYDPLTMPPTLLKAHQKLDKAVDAAYGKIKFKTEAERVAFLFELYQKYVSCLPEKAKSTKKSSTTNQIK